MDDKEYKETLCICAAMVFSFLFFPSFCVVTILFGYVWIGFIIMEGILFAIIMPCFILRTKFLIKYPKYTTKKRLRFETIAYILCLIFAIGTGFAVQDHGGRFTYYLFNIYIQPAYIIFVLVVMGYHVATAKKVAKAHNEETKRRKLEGK